MRCVNCGYENEAGRKTCIKCNAALPQNEYAEDRPKGAYAADEDTKPTVIFNGTPQRGNRDQQLKETVVQGNRNVEKDGYMDLHKTVAQDALTSCPRCHYPITGNYCANCGLEIAAPETTAADVEESALDRMKEQLKNRRNKCPNCGTEVPADFKFCPQCATAIPQPTIDLFTLTQEHANSEAEQEELPQCFLTPIVTGGQTQPGCIQLELKDGIVILNRDNIAPGNRTITSKEQASITYSDGKWILENKSEYNSTFIAVLRPMELQAGDTILMGDMRFRFSPADNKADE